MTLTLTLTFDLRISSQATNHYHEGYSADFLYDFLFLNWKTNGQ